jgi:hypothetical protein
MVCVCVCVCVFASAFRRYRLHLFSQYGILWTHLPLKCFTFSQHKQNTESERTQPYHTHMESVVNKALTPFPFLTIIRELCVLEKHTHTHKIFLFKNHFYELHSIFFLISITFTKRNKKAWLSRFHHAKTSVYYCVTLMRASPPMLNMSLWIIKLYV